MGHLFHGVFPSRQTTDLATNPGDMDIFPSYIPRQDDCTDNGIYFTFWLHSYSIYICNMAMCELQILQLLIKEKGK